MTRVLRIMAAAAMVTACSESTTSPSSISIIHVSAPTSTLVIGDSVEVRVFATAADGSPFPLTTVEWTSSDVAIATVTAKGALTAEVRTIGAGSVTITALVQSHSGQITLAVTAVTHPPLPLETLPWLAFIWSRETGMMALTFPPGAGPSYATGINDLGQVVGSVYLGNETRAFVWTLEGGMTDIGSFLAPVRFSYASAINNAGQVVGGSLDAFGHIRAFRWTPSEGLIALPMPAGTVESRARGINASGQVVGVRDDGVRWEIPFRWSQEKGTEDLPLFGSDSYGAAMAIADNGDVVGYSGGVDNYNDLTRAVLWSANGTKQIIDACTGGSIGWDYGSTCHSSANAINNAGQIAGNSDNGGSPVAFRLTVGANRQDIPAIPGQSTSTANAMNEAGQVVGSSNWFVLQVGEVGRGFLWSPISGTVDLGALPGRQASTATGINNRGQVVGYSY